MWRTFNAQIVRPFARATVALVAVLAGCPGDFGAPTPDTRAGEVAPPDVGPPKRVLARKFVAPIYEAPRSTSRKLGYLRAGATLRATTGRPVGYQDCEGGWFELTDGGYVCDSYDVVAFHGERLPQATARQPDRDAAMPYEYATVTQPTRVFRRLPTADELASPESLSAAIMQTATGKTLPLILKELRRGYYVSLDRTFDKDGVTFWRTQQNGFIEASRIIIKPVSAFRGIDLRGDAHKLPLVAMPGRTWAAPSAHTPRGAIVARAKRRPTSIDASDRWIALNLRDQTLVAYEGDTPVYVTLMSSGKAVASRADPTVFRRDDRTPTGLFRIRAKHLTATMDGDEPGEAPYYLEDVPYVMYFHGAYAFHTAFWHDKFGEPRSHGCINLAPADAKWLYEWASPDLPRSWHGGFATDRNPGTWVWIHGETPFGAAR